MNKKQITKNETILMNTDERANALILQLALKQNLYCIFGDQNLCASRAKGRDKQ